MSNKNQIAQIMMGLVSRKGGRPKLIDNNSKIIAAKKMHSDKSLSIDDICSFREQLYIDILISKFLGNTSPRFSNSCKDGIFLKG